MTFQLHPNFNSKIFILDLPLCSVVLENESKTPWLMLIPRKMNGADPYERIMQLDAADQLQLLKEIDLAQKILWEEFKPTQLNIAQIGNKTRQLHVHIVARYETDPAWPGTVWDTQGEKSPYLEEEKQAIIKQLHYAFKNVNSSLLVEC